MPTYKNVRVDFYRVRLPEDQPSFSNMLRSIIETPVARRNADVKDRTLRLQTLNDWNNCMEGELVRIRINDMPSIAGMDGSLSDLDLPLSKGVGECAAFLYDESTQVLAIQRNIHGASASSFAGYCDRILNLVDGIELVTILQESEYAKLKRLSNPRKFEVSVARVADPVLRKGSTGDFARVAAARGAFTMKLELSVGKVRDASLAQRIFSDIDNLMSVVKDDKSAVTRLKVSGHDQGDEIVAVDLLSGKMKETVKIDVTHLRTIPYDMRRDVIRRAYDTHRASLRRMFRATA